jgi:hypothetical protein
MTSAFSSLFGHDIPEGVPPALAVSIMVSGYTESESRSIISEQEDAETTETWMEALRTAGFFETITNPDTDALTEDCDTEEDGSNLLWQLLKKELQANESDFKHRIYVLDNAVKQFRGFPDLKYLCDEKASAFIPFSAVRDNCPWNGCKFASNTLLLLVSKADALSKRDAVRPVSMSLGGCSIPPPEELNAIRWPYELSVRFEEAKLAAETKGACTALLISVTDVEVMRNPVKKGTWFDLRPGTFAHNCVMTVSPVGIYLYQAYGRRGYTLLQNIEEHDASYPLPLATGEAWVQRFEEFAADLGGAWTPKTNAAYKFCFGVDLVEFGNMRIGSELDAYFNVYAFRFSADLVKKNFALLPRRDDSGTKIPCLDGVDAKSTKDAPSKRPDGGATHYYVPTVIRCGYRHCGANTIRNKRCVACKIVHYCSKDCQVKDWKLGHKNVCKTLASRDKAQSK